MIPSQTVYRPDRRALVTNIVVTLLIALVTENLLSAFGLNRRFSERWPSFAPAGHAIGAIWVVLFGCMGAARWYALSASREHGPDDARAVAVLIVLCLTYPFYTHFIGGHATELTGNIVTLVYALWLALRLRKRSGIATLLIGTVAAWIVFATVLVFALVQLNGWAT